MSARTVIVLLSGALALAAAAVVVWRHSSRGEVAHRPATSAVRLARMPPAARRVASVFVRSLVRGDRAATRRVLDRTYPCGLGEPYRYRDKTFLLPLDKYGLTARGVRFREPAMVRDSVVVEVGVRSRRGRYGSFQMQLKQRGRGRWRVSYFDFTWGPITPWLCMPRQTSS